MTEQRPGTAAIQVTVLGEPIPQGSKKVYGGHIVDDNAAKLKPWRAAVSNAVAEQTPDDWDRRYRDDSLNHPMPPPPIDPPRDGKGRFLRRPL